MPKTRPFDKHSDRYDAWFDKNRGIYNAELAAIRELMPFRPAKGLEVGVGSGKFALPLGIKIGVEPSESMAAKAEASGIQVFRNVAEALPFSDSEFDFVLMVTTIYFVDDISKSFREAFRVLKPKGYIIVGFVDKESELGKQYSEKRGESDFYREATFFSAQEVGQKLLDAGFGDLTFKQTLIPGHTQEMVGLLTWVAGMGSSWLGFMIFFILSLGLGTPLFVLALFSGQLQRLPRAGGWMLWVRNLMGWVLVGMAAYFIRPILPEILKIALPAAVALAAGLHLGWLDKNQAGFRAFPWMKTIVGTACLVLATFWITAWAMRGPGIDWQAYSQTTLQQVTAQGKPVIIDFYADWCTPCRELEAVTFHHADVVRQTRNDFIMIKVDVTKGGNPLHEQLLKQYGVQGVPTIVFLDDRGKERTDLRLVDFLPPEPFLGRMAALKKTTQP